MVIARTHTILLENKGGAPTIKGSRDKNTQYSGLFPEDLGHP